MPRPPNRPAGREPRKPPPPLDTATLERLALRYVERFATTRAKLIRYLGGKLRERGWAGEREPDPAALAERLAKLGYVDDAAFATARAGALTRRGMGAGRVRGALRAAGVAAPDDTEAQGVVAAGTVTAALTLARRKRLGPFGPPIVDRAGREKQIATLIRGGHGFSLARAIVTADPDADLDDLLAPFGLDEGPC